MKKYRITKYGDISQRGIVEIDEDEDDCPCCRAANGIRPGISGDIIFLEEEIFIDGSWQLQCIRRVERQNDGWPAVFFCVKVTKEQVEKEIQELHDV